MINIIFINNRFIFRLLIICIGILINYNSVISQWEQTSGPSGEIVVCFVEYGNHFYIGTMWVGVYKSLKNDINWSLDTNGLPDTWIRDMIVFNDKLYLAINNGIYSKSFEDVSWKLTNDGLDDIDATCFEIKDSNLFVGTVNGVFRLNIDEDYWESCSIGLPEYAFIRAMSKSGKNLVASIAIFGIERLYISTNNGLSWAAVEKGLSGVKELAAIDSVLFAIGEYFLVYRSTDHGLSWTRVEFPGGLATSIASTNNRVFIGTLGIGIYYSTDHGLSWNNTKGKPPWRDRIYNTKFTGNHLFVATEDGELNISNDYGSNWINAEKGLANSRVDKIKKYDKYLIAARITKGIFLSTDNGDNWKRIFYDSQFDTQAKDFVVIDSILIVSTYYGVYRCNLNNFDYLNKSNGLEGESITLLKTFENRLFAGGEALSPYNRGGFFKSTNLGENWSKLSNSITDTNNVRKLTYSNGNLYFCNLYNIFKSTNLGESWISLNFDGLGDWIYDIKASDTNLYVGTKNGLYFTSNNGMNWSLLNNGIESKEITDIFIINNNLFARNSSYEIIYSSDYGLNWHSINEGLDSNDIRQLAISDEYLFVGTLQNGVWRRKLTDVITTVVDNYNKIPQAIELHQNIPNPVNSTTKISFKMPSKSFVTIKLYDVLGNEINTIISDNFDIGNHEVFVNLENLVNGVYFYQLNADSMILTRKLIVCR